MSYEKLEVTRGLMEAYSAVHAYQEGEYEVEELALDIIENAGTVLFSQGYDVYDLISYLADAGEKTITEDYVAFSEGRVLLENITASDEYIDQQFKNLRNISEYLISEGLWDSAMKFIGRVASKPARMAAGQKLAQSANPARTAGAYERLAKQKLTKAGFDGSKATFKTTADAARASAMAKPAGFLNKAVSKVGGAFQAAKGALTKVAPGLKGAAKIGGKALPGVGAALYGMDAADRLKKGDWGGAALSGAGAVTSLIPGAGLVAGLAPAGIQMATDALGLTGDKSRKGASAKTAPAAKYNASKALGGQTAFKAGGGAAAMKKNPNATAADVQKAGNQALFKAGGGNAAMQGKTRAQVIAQGSKAVGGSKAAKTAPGAAPEVKATNAIASQTKQPDLKPAAGKPATGTLGKTSFERRTPTSAEFKGAQEYRQQNPGAKPEDVLKAAQTAGKSQSSVDADLAKANTPAELNKPAPAGTALAKEQERRRKAEQQQQQPVNASYEYDAYDMVLEYLFNTQQVDSISEAHYVMLEMDAETIQSIIEDYKEFPTAKVMNKAGKLMGSAAGKKDSKSKKKEQRGIKMMNTMMQQTPDR